VPVELLRDVPDHLRQVAPVDGRGEEAAGPAYSSRDAPVRAYGSDALHEPDEVAETAVGTEADDQVHVIGEHGAAEEMDR
jgi:hypothetical protein